MITLKCGGTGSYPVQENALLRLMYVWIWSPHAPRP